MGRNAEKTLGVIVARSGSKGLPGKNMAELGQRPLLDWTIAAALESKLDRTILSTDDEAMAAFGHRAGVEVPFLRPASLARDNSSSADTLLHALDFVAEHGSEPQYALLLQPTSPFRTGADIDAAIAAIRARDADALVSVTETHCHPYLVRRYNADGWLQPFVADDQLTGDGRRQSFPAAFFVNGAIFLVRTDVFRRTLSFYPEKLAAYEMPPQRSMQIDSAADLDMARAWLLWRERVNAGEND